MPAPPEQRNGHKPATDGGGPARSDRAHFGKSEPAEDHPPVEEDVRHVPHDHRNHYRPDEGEGLDGLAERDEGKVRQDSQDAGAGVSRGKRNDFDGLPEWGQDLLARDEGEGERNRKRTPEHQSAMDGP